MVPGSCIFEKDNAILICDTSHMNNRVEDETRWRGWTRMVWLLHV